jgi:hypothetical protein
VHPQSNEFIRLLDSLGLGIEETLEHVGQVTYIELIMEVLGSFSEFELNVTEQLEGGLDN